MARETVGTRTIVAPNNRARPAPTGPLNIFPKPLKPTPVPWSAPVGINTSMTPKIVLTRPAPTFVNGVDALMAGQGTSLTNPGAVTAPSIPVDTGYYTGTSTTPVVPAPPGDEAPGTTPPGASTGDATLDALSSADRDAIMAAILAESGLTLAQLLASDTDAANLYKVLYARNELDRAMGVQSTEGSYASRGLERSGLLARDVAQVQQNYNDLLTQYVTNRDNTLKANEQARQAQPDIVAGKAAEATRMTEDEVLAYIREMNALNGQ